MPSTVETVVHGLRAATSEQEQTFADLAYDHASVRVTVCESGVALARCLDREGRQEALWAVLPGGGLKGLL